MPRVSALRFELGPVQVSLLVTVGRDAAPGAKVRFWVIEAGADARVSGGPGDHPGAHPHRYRRLRWARMGRRCRLPPLSVTSARWR